MPSEVKGFKCAVCRECTFKLKEFYMVSHETWQKHGSGKRMLCIGCLEKRLGRELTAKDFLPCILTNMILAKMHAASPRLLDRLKDYVPSKEELDEFGNYFFGHLPPGEREKLFKNKGPRTLSHPGSSS